MTAISPAPAPDGGRTVTWGLLFARYTGETPAVHSLWWPRACGPAKIPAMPGPAMVSPAFRLLILFLAAGGFLLAAYFTGVTYRLIPADAPWIPRVCRLKEESCRRIVDTPRARVFGVPNSLLGMGWYAGLAGLAAAGWAPSWVAAACQVVAWGTVALGAFLTWSLLREIRVRCVLCFTAHALNLGLALVLTRAL